MTQPAHDFAQQPPLPADWSPVLDLEIIARTIWVILARRV